MVLRGGGGLTATGPAPLILTLRLDAPHQARFDALRAAHFPPERNFLAAHVTLFHKLPGEEATAIAGRLRRVVAETAPPQVEVCGLRSLGGGVAYRLRSPAADALRRRLADGWRDRLGAQDSAKGALHLTVQNKVAPALANATLAALSQGFAPTRFASPGLDLWRYLGGPWERAAGFDFSL